MKKKFYVYFLKSDDNKIIYVGKGSGDRMYKHIHIANGKSVNRSKNLKLYNKISSIRKRRMLIYRNLINFISIKLNRNPFFKIKNNDNYPYSYMFGIGRISK